MEDYFNNEFIDDHENDDTFRRWKERPYTTLSEAIEYDQNYINQILNYPKLSDGDKCNIARTVKMICFELLEMTAASASFESFIEEVIGEESFNNITAKWIQRKANQFAAKTGCIELFNDCGLYFYNPNDDEEDEDDGSD